MAEEGTNAPNIAEGIEVVNILVELLLFSSEELDVETVGGHAFHNAEYILHHLESVDFHRTVVFVVLQKGHAMMYSGCE